MTSKQKDAARILLAVNGVKLIIHGEQPVNSRLLVRREEMMSSMMCMRTLSPKVQCMGNIFAYYTHAEENDSSAKYDYPQVYAEVESVILGNEQFRDFLSAYADGLDRDGDPTAVERLKAAHAYVESGSGKSDAMSELGISEKSSAGRGCMIPLVLTVGTIIGLLHCGMRMIS